MATKKLHVLLGFLFLISSVYSQQKKLTCSPTDPGFQSGNSITSDASLYHSGMPANDSIHWVVPLTNYANRTAKAPSNRYKYQRCEYLVKANEIATGGLAPGAVIGSIGFFNISGGVGALTGKLQIYMKNTTDTAYTLGSTWDITGFTRVFSGSEYVVDVDQCAYKINLDTDSLLTYSGGGLYIAWEFCSPDGIPSTVHVFQNCYVSTDMLQYGNTGSTSLPVSLTGSTIRPATFLSPLHNWVDVVRITNIYTIERMPIPYTAPQPIGVRVNNVTSMEHSFQLTLTITDSVTSSVKYTANQSVVLPGDSATLVDFPGWYPDEAARLIYSATTSSIPDETFVLNNNLELPGEANDSAFSYSYNSKARMSWGWTWPDDGIFAVRFHMKDRGLIDGAFIKISYLTGSVGNKIKTVVLDSGGNIVGTSPEYVIQIGDLDQRKYLGFIEPVEFCNEPFFVGLYLFAGSAQWYGLTTGFEAPLRSCTMYTFPSTGGQAYEYTPNESNSKWLIDASVTSMVGVRDPRVSGDFFTVFPNPSTGNLYIDFGTGLREGNAAVEVYDDMGEKVLTGVFQTGAKHSISLEGLKSGIYLFRVTSGGQTGTAKIVKK